MDYIVLFGFLIVVLILVLVIVKVLGSVEIKIVFEQEKFSEVPYTDDYTKEGEPKEDASEALEELSKVIQDVMLK